MDRQELLPRISINPEICFGKAGSRGHRIWVYPQLEEADVLACLAYGREIYGI